MTTSIITKEPAAMSATALAITPIPADEHIVSMRTGTLTHINAQQITERLGIDPTRNTIEGQCDHTWRFRVGEHDCSIWDMKGSGRFGMWSTCGPAEIFNALFGWRAVL